MKWDRVKWSYRLFFGVMGAIGVLFGTFLLPPSELLRQQPVDTLVFLAIAGAGAVMALLIAIVGKFPALPVENERDDRSEK
jgi:hypothetical protein